jgi:hypothetical protein
VKQDGWICDGCGKWAPARFGWPYEWLKVKLLIRVPKTNRSYPPKEGVPDAKTKYELHLCSEGCLALWARVGAAGSLVARTKRVTA